MTARTTGTNCECRKRAYASKLDALIALCDIEVKDRPGAEERRAYHCPHGNGWHLTKQPRRPPHPVGA